MNEPRAVESVAGELLVDGLQDLELHRVRVAEGAPGEGHRQSQLVSDGNRNVDNMQGSGSLSGLRFGACLVLKFALQRGRKESQCKFQNKAHRTFDPRNNYTPVYCVHVSFIRLLVCPTSFAYNWPEF